MPDEIRPSTLYGKLVRVHYNLHRCRPLKAGEKPPAGESCFVVSLKQGSAWKVAGYVPSLLIKDGEMKVSESGVKRIREQKSRAVVAWIIGTAVDPNSAAMMRATGNFDNWEGVRFNPFLSDTFFLAKTQRPIHEAELINVSGRRMIAKLNRANPDPGPRSVAAGCSMRSPT